MDWWAPLGAGELRVVQLLDDGARRNGSSARRGTGGARGHAHDRRSRADGGARHKHVAVSAGDEVVAEVDFRPTPQEKKFGDWVKPLHLVGEELLITDDKDKDGGRRGRLRGAVRFLRIQGPGRSWVWHFEGGVVAGRRLVLGRGGGPVRASPWSPRSLPSAGRGLGHVKRHQAVDTHVTRWRPKATAAEVALVEL